jgi:CDP-diglyceride synthetase
MKKFLSFLETFCFFLFGLFFVALGILTISLVFRKPEDTVFYILLGLLFFTIGTSILKDLFE